MTREEIETAIAELRAAKHAKLTGKGRLKVGSPEGGNVEYQAITVAEIDMEIARLQVELGKLTGQASGVAPVLVESGGRT